MDSRVILQCITGTECAGKGKNEQLDSRVLHIYVPFHICANINKVYSWALWHVPSVTMLGRWRQRQVDPCEFTVKLINLYNTHTHPSQSRTQRLFCLPLECASSNTMILTIVVDMSLSHSASAFQKNINSPGGNTLVSRRSLEGRLYIIL